MNLIHLITASIAITLCVTSGALCNELKELEKSSNTLRFFDSGEWKPNELEPSDWERIRQAEAHLIKNHKTLVSIVKNKQEGWNFAAYALARSKNPEVAPLFIELVRQNYYLKEADGSRKQFGFGSPNGCEAESNTYGAVLASFLGMIGDQRAVPILKEALLQGDSDVQKSAYYALYKLGSISFNQLLEIAKNATESPTVGRHAVMSVVNDVRKRNPRHAIELYDQIIAALPKDCYEVASAYYSKINCYEDLKNYEQALKQCDILLEKVSFKNYTSQLPGLKKRLIKLAQKDRDQRASSGSNNKVKEE